MIDSVDVTNLSYGKHISERLCNQLQAELRKVVAANLGFERFVAAYDAWTRRIEVVFIRDGVMSWYRMPPSEASVKEFLLALPVLVTLQPELAQWPRVNRV